MGRARQRVCLQDGLKLDLNRLARNSFIKPSANIGSRGIRWTHSYWGEIAGGMISPDMSGQKRRLAAGSAWRSGSENDSGFACAPFWWQTMVLHVSREKPSRVGALEAIGRNSILQSANMRPTSCLPIAVQRRNESSAWWAGQDQISAAWGP
jgi:hypothetical protein